jgi:hypothetical protein
MVQTSQEFVAKYTKSVLNMPQASVDNTIRALEYGIFIKDLKPITDEQLRLLIDVYGLTELQLKSSFYKTWQEHDDRGEAGRFVDQMLHYIGTYCFGVCLEPNDVELTKDDRVMKHFITIEVLEKKEIVNKLTNLFESGIALESQDIDAAIAAFIDYSLTNVNLKNKEMMIRLARDYAIMPKDASYVIRIMYDIATNGAQYIKSRRALRAVEFALKQGDSRYYGFEQFEQKRRELLRQVSSVLVNSVATYGVDELGKTFRQHKATWLVFRKYMDKYDRSLINKIKRASEKNHIKGHTETYATMDEKAFTKFVKNATIYQLVTIINYFNRLETETDYELYRVRNGLPFVKDVSKRKVADCSMRRAFVENEMRERYANKFKDQKWYLPKGLDVKMPTSMKNFVGEYPMYTSYEVDGNNQQLQFGIAWAGDHPHQHVDIDLHAVSANGNHIGWNSRHASGMTHSGDMISVNAFGLAAEYVKINRQIADDVILLNMSVYSSAKQLDKIHVIVGDGKVDGEKLRSIQESKHILHRFVFNPAEVTNGSTFAACVDNKIVLTNFVTNSRIPNVELQSAMANSIQRSIDTSMSLVEFARIVGIDVVEEQVEGAFDFTNVSRSDFTDLFAI